MFNTSISDTRSCVDKKVCPGLRFASTVLASIVPALTLPYQILFILPMPGLCLSINPFKSVGDLSTGVCQFQDAADDPTILSRGRERESAGVILRWPRSVELSLIVWAAGRGWNANS